MMEPKYKSLGEVIAGWIADLLFFVVLGFLGYVAVCLFIAVLRFVTRLAFF